MPLRFQKRIRLFKGLTINLSKSGASVSIGGRGARINISKRGTRTTVGLPGTGISYSTLSKPTDQSNLNQPLGVQRDVVEHSTQIEDQAKSKFSWPLFILALICAVIVIMMFRA